MSRGRPRRIVEVRLDATSALVMGRHRRRLETEHHTATTPDDAGLLLRQVLGASDLLRPGTRCEVRIVWDPQRLLLRLTRHDGAAEGVSARPGFGSTTGTGPAPAAFEPDSFVARVALPPTPGTSLAVMVRTTEVARLAAALRASRVEGHAHLDVGVVSRTRAVLGRVAPLIGQRPGLVVDVSRSHVFVLALRGVKLELLRGAPRSDLPIQIGRMFAELTAALAAPDRSRPDTTPWLSIHADVRDVDDVRAACRSAMSPGARTAVLRTTTPRRTVSRVAPDGDALPVVGALDLLAERPERRLGRGAPRLLRHASSVVLVALLGSVGVAAGLAVRAPAWTDDLGPDSASSAQAPRRVASVGVRHADLALLLYGLEELQGVRLEHADVRAASDAMERPHEDAGRAFVTARVALSATDVVGIGEVLDRLEHPAVLDLEVVDYVLAPSGALATLAMQVRHDTHRLASPPSEVEPTAAIPALVLAAGAEVLSVRLPGPDELGQHVLLTSVGPVASITRLIDRLESTHTSTGRIGSISLRRHDDGRAVLDISFTLRERFGGGGSSA